MKKLIVMALIIMFVGSAAAENVEFHFTAVMNGDYTDGSGIFSELGYSDNMTITGVISFDTEGVILLTYKLEDEAEAFVWYNTGSIIFTDQGFEWTDGYSSQLLITNPPEEPPLHMIQLMVSQASVGDFSDVAKVSQKITITNDGWDTSIPVDLKLGDISEYSFEISKLDNTVSTMKGTITSILNSEEYAESLNTAEAGNSIKGDLDALSLKVNELRIRKKTKKSMMKKLNKAEIKLNDKNRNNDQAAINMLEAFINQVEARKGSKRINTEVAEGLIRDTEAIITRLKKESRHMLARDEHGSRLKNRKYPVDLSSNFRY